MFKKSSGPVWTCGPVLAVSLLLGACGGGDSTPAPTQQAVAGTVLDASTGDAVEGATVQSGETTATTGADGKFTLGIAANARAILRITKTAYAENVVVTEVAGGGNSNTVLAHLLPVTVTGQVSATAGGTVSVPDSSAQVILSPASLVRVDGLPISGMVSVAVTPINSAVNPAYMPGDFTAMRPGTGGAPAAQATIESYGAMTVTMTDASGARVNLAPATTATIRIPLSSRGVPAAAIPLFYFDAGIGRWVEQGSATLAGSAPNQYYEGSVSHFSTWNADQYVDTINVTGCVETEAGVRVTGARVVSEGVDYSGTASGVTDSSGNFSVGMKKSAVAVLSAQSGTRFSNSLSVGPSPVNFASTIDGKCLVLGNQGSGLSIKLTWGASPADVDAHLFAPDGSHVYHGQRGDPIVAPFVGLDVDDTDSFGPEVMTVRRLMVGTYRYAAHNYSSTFAPGMTASPTRIELTAAGDTTVFTPPAGEGANGWWNVFSFTVDAQCRITVTPVGSWSQVSPQPAETSEPSYCVAP